MSIYHNLWVYMNKYRNKEKNCYQDHLHASIKEAGHCNVLTAMKQSGEILDYAVEPKITLQEAFMGWDGKMVRAITFKPDFVVYGDGYTEYQDVKAIDRKTGKPRMTEAFQLRWKMLQAKFQGESCYRFKIV